jgi:hypothetical protein
MGSQLLLFVDQKHIFSRNHRLQLTGQIDGCSEVPMMSDKFLSMEHGIRLVV